MTQAPTPGPLSGDDVNRECKACGAFKPDLNAACTFCGLALLSARPLALGGQQGEEMFGVSGAADEVEALACAIWAHRCPGLLMDEDDDRPHYMDAARAAFTALEDTTPARAEAQDEGAATDDLVDRFAVALKAKLRTAGEKYGFDDAWKADDWRDKLIEDLLRHIQKGDPRDVAAYCAFAWHHDWSLSPKQDDLRSAAFTDRGAEDRYVSQDEGAAGERDKLVAALADALAFIDDMGTDIHHARVADWYPEGANNAEVQMSEDMRLAGNRCATYEPLVDLNEIGSAHPSPPPAADSTPKRTMTLNLTEEEMAALEALSDKKDLDGPKIFRLALRQLQLTEHEREHGPIGSGPLGLTPPAADADRVRIAVELINAEINAPLTGSTHGAWDRGRIAGLKEALAALKSEGK